LPRCQAWRIEITEGADSVNAMPAEAL
jgi:hypothetical protein